MKKYPIIFVLLLVALTVSAATIPTTIKLRRDTAANWTLYNPVLAKGEPGVEEPAAPGGESKMKIGDGVTAWSSLPYFVSGPGGVTVHGNLTGRDEAGQHPISAITGLSAVLTNISTAAQAGGTVAHSNTTGLDGDDHTQYHTDARGDARYPLKSVFEAYTSIDRGGVSAATFNAYTTVDRVTVTTFSQYTAANRNWGGIGGTLSDQTDLQNALNAKQNSITGGATTITGSDLTADRALVSNALGKVAVSSVTAVEQSRLSGVTSSIQTQLNAKVGTTTAFGGDVSGTYNAIVVGDDSHNHTSSSIPLNSFSAAGLVAAGAGSATKVWKTDGSGIPGWRDDVTGSSPTFDAVGGGTNTTSTMTVGTGGTLTYSGSGVLNASKYKGQDGPSATEFAYLSDLESAILEVNDVVNDLTTGGTAVPLSAEQGKGLNTAFVNYTTTDRLTVSAAASTYMTQATFNSYSAAVSARIDTKLTASTFTAYTTAGRPTSAEVAETYATKVQADKQPVTYIGMSNIKLRTTSAWFSNISSATGNIGTGLLATTSKVYKSPSVGNLYTEMTLTGLTGNAFTSAVQYVRTWINPNTGTMFVMPFGNASAMDTAECGLWRSTDGSSFSRVLTPATTPSVSTIQGILQIDYDSSGNLYATRYSRVDGNNNTGVFKSTNDGATWTDITAAAYASVTNQRNHTHGISIDRTQTPNVIYVNVAERQGVPLSNGEIAAVKSNDGGTTWTAAYTTNTATYPRDAVLTALVGVYAGDGYRLYSGEWPTAGNGGTPATGGTRRILRTTDDSTFTVVHEEELGNGNPWDYTWSFVQNGNGNIYAPFSPTGTLLASADEGLTWQKIHSPADITASHAGNLVSMSNFYDDQAVLSYKANNASTAFDNGILITESTSAKFGFSGIALDKISQGNDHNHANGGGAAIPFSAVTITGTCNDTTYVRGDGACAAVSGGTGTPGGSDTQVQFNDGGSFGGEAGFIYDKTNKYFGINATSLEGPIHTKTDSNGYWIQEKASSLNAGAAAGVIFRRARNTGASPQAVQANDISALFAGMGYDATATAGFRYLGAVRIAAEAAPNGANAHPGFLQFMTATGESSSGAADGDASYSEKARLTSAGNLLVGNTDGTSKITATGTIESTTGGFKLPDGAVIDAADDLGGISLASIAAGGTVACSHTAVNITSGSAGDNTTLPADCIPGKVTTVTNSSGVAQDVVAASGYIDDTPGLEWRIPSTGTTQFMSEGTTLGWKAVKHPIPDCDNATASKLLYDATTNTYTCGTDQGGGALTVGDSTATITDTGTVGAFTVSPDATAILKATSAGVRIGDTTSPTLKLEVINAGVAGSATRTSAGTDQNGVFNFIHSNTATDAGDTFGSSISFGFTDSGAANSLVADIGAVRDGADTTGAIVFYPRVAGSRTERARVANDSRLQLDGSTEAGTGAEPSKPTCTAALRGSFWYKKADDTTTTPDTLEFCGHTNVSNTYAWKTVTTWP